MGSGYPDWTHPIMYDLRGAADIETSEIISHSTGVTVTSQNNEDTLRQGEIYYMQVFTARNLYS